MAGTARAGLGLRGFGVVGAVGEPGLPVPAERRATRRAVRRESRTNPCDGALLFVGNDSRFPVCVLDF